jgi:hypothetical protein
LGVTAGRARARREDTWQVALVAAPASLLGPLSAALLLVPSVRRSLREVPVQLRAQGEKLEALGHTSHQTAVEHRQGASLALGIAASTVSFWSGLLLSVWFTFASSTLTDGAGVAFSLFLALIVGPVGLVGVLAFQRRRQALARFELVAAAGMVAAVVCVALDGGDLHWSDGNRVSVSFLYWLWALVALLFAGGAAVARSPTRG